MSLQSSIVIRHPPLLKNPAPMTALGLMMAAGRGGLNAVDVVAMSSSTDALHFVCVVVVVLLVCTCGCVGGFVITWMQGLNKYTHHSPEKCIYSISLFVFVFVFVFLSQMHAQLTGKIQFNQTRSIMRTYTKIWADAGRYWRRHAYQRHAHELKG
jgi:hypothetical protein